VDGSICHVGEDAHGSAAVGTVRISDNAMVETSRGKIDAKIAA